MEAKVKASFRLGSEVYTVNSKDGNLLSEQLALVKEESMGILKEFITKHNIPNDVPDEPLEGSSDDDDAEEAEKPPKPKKQK